MRLLNTGTLEPYFFASDVPKYAILSHRWEAEEVTLTDLLVEAKYREMKGYQKILGSAAVAKEHGYDFIWVDSCCIDKSSSAELSEAINSMFQWYGGSGQCYVYLSDVNDLEDLSKSQWFRRGWTLQELLAPENVVFYNCEWIRLGTKADLSREISIITGISEKVLLGQVVLSEILACNKMAWASERITTRPEDMAYCLMGLFDINMPLLYGEGAERAFRRLQEAFIRQSDDESIFAWSAESEEAKNQPFWGLLAPSARFFHGAGSYVAPVFKIHRHNSTTNVTNSGLRVSWTLQPLEGDVTDTLFVVPLNCAKDEATANDLQSLFTIIVQRISDFEDQYARVRPDLLFQGISFKDTEDTSKVATFYVRSLPRTSNNAAGFWIPPEQSVPFEFPSNSATGPVVYCGKVDVKHFLGNDEVDVVLLEERRGSLDVIPTTHTDEMDEFLTKNKIPCGIIQLEVSSWVEQEPRGPFQLDGNGLRPQLVILGARRNIRLKFGLEVIAETILETPAGFLKPWYLFETDGDNDESLDQDQLVYKSQGTRLRVIFEIDTYRFRPYWKIKVVEAE